MKAILQNFASVPSHIPTELGCVVRLVEKTQIDGLPAWACTLWFQGSAWFAIIPLPETPNLPYLLRHMSGRPDLWVSTHA